MVRRMPTEAPRSTVHYLFEPDVVGAELATRSAVTADVRLDALIPALPHCYRRLPERAPRSRADDPFRHAGPPGTRRPVRRLHWWRLGDRVAQSLPLAD